MIEQLVELTNSERPDAVVVAGDVFDAAKEELYWAEKGAGAYCNETRLRVSGRRNMMESIFATGVPFGGKSTLPATLQDFARLMPVCAGVRRFGAASLDLAYVASGRYDGYWERGVKTWDVAAGLILVKEAGGFVGPLREGRDIFESGSLIATNTELFDPLCKILRQPA